MTTDQKHCDASLRAVHEAARLLQSYAADRRVARSSREQASAAATALYSLFGEPAQPMTSVGGNYFEQVKR